MPSVHKYAEQLDHSHLLVRIRNGPAPSILESSVAILL